MQSFILHLNVAVGTASVSWGKARDYFFLYFAFCGLNLVKWKAIANSIYFNLYQHETDSGKTLGHMIKTSNVLKNISAIINCK